MGRALRGPAAPVVDMSRKTSLVGRRSGPAHAGMRTGAGRLAEAAWRFCGFLAGAGAIAWMLAAPDSPPTWQSVTAASVLFPLLAARVVARIVRIDGVASGRAASSLEQDLDLAVLVVIASHLLVFLTGGLESPAAPILYVSVSLLVVLHRPVIGVVAVAVTLGLELGLAVAGGELHDRAIDVAARGIFVVVFALLFHVTLAGAVATLQDKTRRAIGVQLADLRRRAREYRLIVSSGGDDLAVQGEVPGREKWIAAAVEEIDGAIRAALEVVECALGTHTTAVYLLSADEKTLRLRECLSASDQVARYPISAVEGLPGVVLRQREPVRLHGAFRGAIYYKSGTAPRAFLGVPLIEHRPGGPPDGELRGILVADRLEGDAFDESDERLLVTIGGEILRRMELERVMGYIREEKDEKVRFYRAIESLNVLSKPDEVCEAIVRLANELAPLDFVAVTLTEEGGGEGEPNVHRIVEAKGPGADHLKGRVFEDNSSLVTNVVKLGSPLPGRDFHEMDRKVVFSEELEVNGLSTLKVLPLLVGENVIGTLVCGAKSKGALVGDSIRKLLVLAIQAAGSIARARLFEQTEKLATTDGLTGLNNHRRFQECLEMAMAASRRYQRTVSLVLTDVDHFKSVNDTYGHPVGDVVLKGVAAILKSEARDSDIVARYGGEEFTIILPETDPKGARVIAERIRRRIEAEVFRTDVGPLRVTMSLGVASYPIHGEHKQEIIERADQALYAAKGGGRNQTRIAE